MKIENDLICPFPQTFISEDDRCDVVSIKASVDILISSAVSEFYTPQGFDSVCRFVNVFCLHNCVMCICADLLFT